MTELKLQTQAGCERNCFVISLLVAAVGGDLVDGTNLERNLYLTTQLTELGIPVVIAINMMDVVRKNGDKINTAELSRELGCEIIEISALKGTGIMEAAEAAVKAAKSTKTVPMQMFPGKRFF